MKGKIQAVDVYAESARSRYYVGRLKREYDGEETPGFRFTYEDSYLKKSNAVSLGPELPLTGRTYFSKELFPSVADRIPSRENPAYPEYCIATGITTYEKDPFVLLTTIGKRGPSCFIFEPHTHTEFKAEDAKEFRVSLGLSLREFARLFDFSPYTIQKIEGGKETGRDVLKRMELYVRFTEVAWFEVNRNRAKVHTKTWKRLKKLYSEKGISYAVHNTANARS